MRTLTRRRLAARASLAVAVQVLTAFGLALPAYAEADIPPYPINSPVKNYCFTPAPEPVGNLAFEVCLTIAIRQTGINSAIIEHTTVIANYGAKSTGPAFI
ncbi:hypothetical protein ACGFIY_33100 [Micromonospora chersina]|uniref:hypothetical protein n=1 Tax=Micromonospora chersina TaxID=47854 RepID=UPI0037225388